MLTKSITRSQFVSFIYIYIFSPENKYLRKPIYNKQTTKRGSFDIKRFMIYPPPPLPLSHVQLSTWGETPSGVRRQARQAGLWAPHNLHRYLPYWLAHPQSFVYTDRHASVTHMHPSTSTPLLEIKLSMDKCLQAQAIGPESRYSITSLL